MEFDSWRSRYKSARLATPILSCSDLALHGLAVYLIHARGQTCSRLHVLHKSMPAPDPYHRTLWKVRRPSLLLPLSRGGCSGSECAYTLALVAWPGGTLCYDQGPNRVERHVLRGESVLHMLYILSTRGADALRTGPRVPAGCHDVRLAGDSIEAEGSGARHQTPQRMRLSAFPGKRSSRTQNCSINLLTYLCSGLNSSNRLRAQDNLLFSQVATIDSHLPNFDAQQALHLTKVDQARCVLDTTTLLLDQWPRVAGGWAACRQAAGSLGQDAVDDVVWQKSIANLEHMLRCMQHVALVCLLSDLFNAPRWDHRRTRQDGQGCRKNVVEWFTEWVGGCPPLNSTMPWNIKPSLMVLWGVCWMFYPPAGDWAPGQQPVGQGNVPVPNTTAAGMALPRLTYSTSSRLIPRCSGYANPSPVSNVSNLQYEASATHPSPNLGNNPQPSPIGRINHPNEPSVFSANPMTQSTNHMITYSDPIHALGSSLPYDQGGASSAFSQVSSETIPVANTLPHNPSVAAPLTSGSSSTPFATAPSQSWRGHAGSFSRPFSRISHHASSIASEPAGDEQDISSATTQFHPSYHDHFPSANPYDPNTYDIAVPTATPSPYQQQHPPPFPPQGFVPGPTQGIRGYAPARRLRTGRDVLSMHSSQSYPSPQHSEASEAASLGPVSMPPEGTPQPQLGGIGSSPSLSRSSRRPSSTNTEPPRNAQGQIYCNHPECAAKPPTFSRKCEWTLVKMNPLPKPFLMTRPVPPHPYFQIPHAQPLTLT